MRKTETFHLPVLVNTLKWRIFWSLQRKDCVGQLMLWHECSMLLPNETINFWRKTHRHGHRKTLLLEWVACFCVSAFLSPLTLRCPGVRSCSKLRNGKLVLKACLWIRHRFYLSCAKEKPRQWNRDNQSENCSSSWENPVLGHLGQTKYLTADFNFNRYFLFYVLLYESLTPWLFWDWNSFSEGSSQNPNFHSWTLDLDETEVLWYSSKLLNFEALSILKGFLSLNDWHTPAFIDFLFQSSYRYIRYVEHILHCPIPPPLFFSFLIYYNTFKNTFNGNIHQCLFFAFYYIWNFNRITTFLPYLPSL